MTKRFRLGHRAAALGFAALVSAALTTASTARADTVIDTTGAPNGSVAPWGTPDSAATPTYGQVFVDPAGNPILQSATFFISNCEPTAHRSVPKGSSPLPHRHDEWPWLPPAAAGLGVG